MYIGEFQLGDLLPLQLYTKTVGGVGTLPDDPPRAIVCSTSGQVESHLLPTTDERSTVGRFWHCIPIDARYVEGQYWIQYLYVVTGNIISTLESFRVVPGGHERGTGVSMTHFRRPPNDFILMQTDGGLLLRKKNPEVTV